jgi:hypothetical protein
MPKLTSEERIKRHLYELQAKEKPEPRFGRDRRRRIAIAMVNPDKRGQRFDVITFTRKVMRARDLNHFFNDIANELDVQHVEYLLGITHHA